MRRYGINSVGLLMLQSSLVKLITTAECCHQLTLSKSPCLLGQWLCIQMPIYAET